MASYLGLDVSIYQDKNTTVAKPNFVTAKNAGVTFVILRYSFAYMSSPGMYEDEDAFVNYTNVKAAGLPVGGYHFQTWTRSMSDQATFFAERIAKMPPNLPAFLDFECAIGVPDRATSSRLALEFLNKLESLTGKLPGIYTSPGYWNSHGSLDTAFARFPLWVAHWGVTTPIIPKPWSSADFWQYTSSGNGAKYGMESIYVDLNLCLKPEKYGLVAQPEYTLEEKVNRLWNAHPELH